MQFDEVDEARRESWHLLSGANAGTQPLVGGIEQWQVIDSMPPQEKMKLNSFMISEVILCIILILEFECYIFVQMN